MTLIIKMFNIIKRLQLVILYVSAILFMSSEGLESIRSFYDEIMFCEKFGYNVDVNEIDTQTEVSQVSQETQTETEEAETEEAETEEAETEEAETEEAETEETETEETETEEAETEEAETEEAETEEAETEEAETEEAETEEAENGEMTIGDLIISGDTPVDHRAVYTLAKTLITQVETFNREFGVPQDDEATDQFEHVKELIDNYLSCDTTNIVVNIFSAYSGGIRIISCEFDEDDNTVNIEIDMEERGEEEERILSVKVDENLTVFTKNSLPIRYSSDDE
jgi:flagellar biosynthesis GTPase FlhF